MNEIFEAYIQKALEYEANGEINAALTLFDKIIEVSGEDSVDIEIEKAKLEFRNCEYKEALIDFINIYSKTQSEDIYSLILEAYYYPNADSLDEIYQSNLEKLQEYPHYENEFHNEEVIIHPIWKDNDCVICWNQECKWFVIIPIYIREYEKEKDLVAVIGYELLESNIIEALRSISISVPLLDMNVPLYIYWSKEFFQIYMQIYDVEKILQYNRCIILVGENILVSYLEREDVIFPYLIIDPTSENVVKNAVDEAHQRRVKREKEWKKEIERYYSKSQNIIKKNIKSGKPKILFITSRFTTIVKYHTRDLRNAANKIGCQTRCLIEKDGIHRTEYNELHILAEFKPDIVICIDHFRFERQMPDEVCFVIWAQDPLDDIMNPNTPGKLLDMDFVMNHFTTWSEFKNLKYPENKLIDAPIPANKEIYKPYILTKDEKEKYECDICFVCHASDVESHIKELEKNIPVKLIDLISVLYNGYFEYAYQTGNFFYSRSDFEEYVEGVSREAYGLKLQNDFAKYLVDDMYFYFNQRVFRQVIVDWIIEAGFTNIKLWGNGWKSSPKYEKYAMGPAENGETLSKIYQASKIVIGNNIMTTAAARAWETMLSGGFYLSNYIPPEEDITDIRKILTVGKDVEMFNGREELLYKIKYYLENEEERKKMIQKGRQAALEKMTFDKLMERTIKTIGERL